MYSKCTFLDLKLFPGLLPITESACESLVLRQNMAFGDWVSGDEELSQMGVATMCLLRTCYVVAADSTASPIAAIRLQVTYYVPLLQ